MDLFIVVLAILFLQVWGAENPLHKDAWFGRWVDIAESNVARSELQSLIVSVGVPLLLVWAVTWLISQSSYWPLLPLGVVVVLYSFGRGEFSEIVNEYTSACFIDDWESGVARAAALGVEVEGITENDWTSLHHHVLEEAAYRGFERMFAVLFWFFILGPLGALMYRLLFIYNAQKQHENPSAKKLLWMVEWPAARVLGLSFALTGNFAGCIHRWRESLLCVTRPTKVTVGQSVLGALSVEEDIEQTCEVTQKELSLLDKLYKRTLWFWLAAAAILIILG